MQVDVIGWLGENKTWVFSGIGVVGLTVIGGIIHWFRRKSPATQQQTQQAGACSANLQAGGDIHVSISPSTAIAVPAADIPKKADSSNTLA